MVHIKGERVWLCLGLASRLQDDKSLYHFESLARHLRWQIPCSVTSTWSELWFSGYVLLLQLRMPWCVGVLSCHKQV